MIFGADLAVHIPDSDSLNRPVWGCIVLLARIMSRATMSNTCAVVRLHRFVGFPHSV